MSELNFVIRKTLVGGEELFHIRCVETNDEKVLKSDGGIGGWLKGQFEDKPAEVRE